MSSALQKLINTIGAAHRDIRSQYHLTLGEAIESLEKMPPLIPVVFDFDGLSPLRASSYRGYYCDLAIASVREMQTVEVLLSVLRAALNQPFSGYKGGDFVMDPATPLWASEWGESSGRAIMGITWSSNRPPTATIVTKEVD